MLSAKTSALRDPDSSLSFPLYMAHSIVSTISIQISAQTGDHVRQPSSLTSTELTIFSPTARATSYDKLMTVLSLNLTVVKLIWAPSPVWIMTAPSPVDQVITALRLVQMIIKPSPDF